MLLFKRISLIVLIVAYAAAGANHFIHPGGYIKIIPRYIPYPSFMNAVAGACEITFALLMIFPFTRPAAGWLIVLMLAAFLPVHITMVHDAPLKVGSLQVSTAMAWARLLLQPVLMYCARWSTRVK